MNHSKNCWHLVCSGPVHFSCKEDDLKHHQPSKHIHHGFPGSSTLTRSGWTSWPVGLRMQSTTCRNISNEIDEILNWFDFTSLCISISFSANELIQVNSIRILRTSCLLSRRNIHRSPTDDTNLILGKDYTTVNNWGLFNIWRMKCLITCESFFLLNYILHLGIDRDCESLADTNCKSSHTAVNFSAPERFVSLESTSDIRGIKWANDGLVRFMLKEKVYAKASWKWYLIATWILRASTGSLIVKSSKLPVWCLFVTCGVFIFICDIFFVIC